MNYRNFVDRIKYQISRLPRSMQENYLREELQKEILGAMYHSNTNQDIYFLGGTNLRLSYDLDRFSEDLDFALEAPNSNFDFDTYLSQISTYLQVKDQFSFEIKKGNVRTVRKANIKFSNILYDTGISQLKDQKITIKIEIDTNPPKYAEYSSKILQSFNGPIKIRTQNIQTTFAGKIGAFILREYVKGRDYYDMFWYLSTQSDSKFNLKYLQSVIEQYNSSSDAKVTLPKTHKETLNMVLEKAEKTDYDKVKDDLRRFVSWSDDHLNSFFDTYVESLYDVASKYNKKLLESPSKSPFRL